MDAADHLLDRAIPDRVDTDGLPAVLAAEVDHLAGRDERWCEPRPGTHPGVQARALVAIGNAPRAREVLLRGATSTWTPQGLAAATWAASRVGPSDVLDGLRQELEACDDGFLLDGDVPLTTTHALAGLIAAASGDLDSARRHLDAAIVEGDRRAPLWGALARVEQVRVLQTAAAVAPDDTGSSGAGSSKAESADAAARRALMSASTFFVAGGYRHLAEVTAALAGSPRRRVIAQPRLGHLVRGETWTVGFGVQPPVDVDDRRGLHALRYLIEHRQRRVPAVELAAAMDGASVGDPLRVALEVLDAGTDLAEAELSTALRAVLLDDTVRSRVTKLLRRTITTLATSHSTLAAHLEASVTTGYACRYDADPSVEWRL